MKILLTVLDKGSHINFFPLGVAYLASAARARGFRDITVYNQEVYHYPDEAIMDYLEKGRFDILGVGIYGYQQFKKAVGFLKHVNASRRRPIVILGGHGPTAAPEYFIRKFEADIVVLGEGDAVFCNLLDALAAKRPLEGIKGIAYRDGSGVRVNEREDLISDLDSIPFPAWDLFPMEHYVLEKHIAAAHTDRCFPVLASRGCAYQCNFCYRMDTGYRLRSVENVMEEIRKLQSDYSVTHITFADENLMVSEKHMLRFVEGVARHGLSIGWNCMGRLRVAKPHILKKVKEAGCVYINYGIESLDQNVLDLMNKKQTVEEAYTGVENTIKAGIHPGLNIIWGNIGDTSGSLQKGVDFLNRYNTGIQLRTIKPVTPYPGTALFKLALEKGLLKDAEDFYARYVNSDRMTVNFTGLSDDEFYRLIFEANKTVINNYYGKLGSNAIDGFRRCYFEHDLSYRGVRHR